MSPFPTGSVAKMSRSVSEGHLSVSQATLRRLTSPELDQLTAALVTLQREVRTTRVSQNDPMAIQARARQLQRLRTAMLVISTYRQKFKR